MARTLKYSDDEFWKMTPRKLFSLWKVHLKYEGRDNSENKEDARKGYIDEVF